MSKSRLESFSDGVFAIAITLLVLTIAQPTDYRHLTHDLAHRWPSLAAYVVSFAVIGIMWLNHHAVFANFDRVDRGAVYLNLFLLMTIAFLPYPTGVLGEALAQHRGATSAAVFYGVTMALNAYAWGALWLYASYRRRLLNQSFPEEERRMATILFNIGGVAYTVAVGVAFLNAYAFLVLQGALAVYYALDPLSRRAAPRGTQNPREQHPAGHDAGGHDVGGHIAARHDPRTHDPALHDPRTHDLHGPARHDPAQHDPAQHDPAQHDL